MSGILNSVESTSGVIGPQPYIHQTLDDTTITTGSTGIKLNIPSLSAEPTCVMKGGFTIDTTNDYITIPQSGTYAVSFSIFIYEQGQNRNGSIFMNTTTAGSTPVFGTASFIFAAFVNSGNLTEYICITSSGVTEFTAGQRVMICGHAQYEQQFVAGGRKSYLSMHRIG